MTSPQFEIRPSVIRGDPADEYLHWTKEILRLESKNPKVLMEFYASRGGVVCGIEEVKSLLASVLPKIDDSAIANVCLLYTSPSPRDATLSRMPSSA